MKKSLITLATVATLVAAGAGVAADTATNVNLAKSVVVEKTPSTASVLNEAFVKAQTAYLLSLGKEGRDANGKPLVGRNSNGEPVLGLAGAKTTLVDAENALKEANKALTDAKTAKNKEVKAVADAEDPKIAAAEATVTQINEAIVAQQDEIAKQEAEKKRLNLNSGLNNEAATQAIKDADDAIAAAEGKIASLKQQLEVATAAVTTAKEAKAEAVAKETKKQDDLIAAEETKVANATKAVETAKTAVADWTAASEQLKAELEDARLALIKNGLTNDQIKKLVDQAQAEVKAETTSVIRLYNPTTGFHWFTTDSGRASTMRANGWNLEGVAFNAPVTGVPVFAVSNPNTGYSHFTANADEIAGLEKLGWVKGEVVFYTATEGVSVKRLYNPNTGLHFFTSNSEEAAGLVAKGWNLEGHAYYVAK